ncbi:hypothetical protein MSG28_003376 [Choristoneura fumiferana]|uniref:Uncharacterized protein n=1 Tax=Choristoneura fumiferana TaxID=7141 RepID=A0ACC0KF99_CHOFU|nr:hypothetical protein MSG28_003376 [Choristoneura fumiferana]
MASRLMPGAGQEVARRKDPMYRLTEIHTTTFYRRRYSHDAKLHIPVTSTEAKAVVPSLLFGKF